MKTDFRFAEMGLVPDPGWLELDSAAFSPDGTRVVTASSDKTARVWNVRPDTRTLADWARVAERSPFVLNDQGVLVLRSLLRAQKPSD